MPADLGPLGEHAREHLQALLAGDTQPLPATCQLCMSLRAAGWIDRDEQAGAWVPVDPVKAASA